MSFIIDGQPVNAAVTNAAFLFKDVNDTALAKIAFNDQDLSSISGNSVANAQREYNSIWSFLGGVVNQSKTYLPTWASNFFGLSTDNIKERIEAIDQSHINGLMSYRAGRAQLSVGTKTVTVIFSTPMNNANYILSFGKENLLDSKPIYLWENITEKTVNGFTIVFNAAPDTGNYYLNFMTRNLI